MRALRRLALPLLLAALVGSACSQAATDAVPPPVPAADAQSLLMVSRAQAFLATLTPAQRAEILYPWSDDEQRHNWSNFPEGSVRRGGLAWGDLDAAQRTALTGLLGAILSPRGVRMVRDQMDADELLSHQSSGPFGERLYFVSFVGTPSATAPWMVKFGGHHLAINATIVGPHMTVSPMLSGGQPLTLGAGRRIEATDTEIFAAHALMASLRPDQRRTAIRSPDLMYLQLGAGRDGRTLAGEGIAGSALDEAQKAKLLAVIEARLGVINADDHAPLIAAVRAGLDRTIFGWWGPVSPTEPAYWRIVGPSLILEYSPQDAEGEHAHNIYRDPGNDYARAWVRVD